MPFESYTPPIDYGAIANVVSATVSPQIAAIQSNVAQAVNYNVNNLAQTTASLINNVQIQNSSISGYILDRINALKAEITGITGTITNRIVELTNRTVNPPPPPPFDLGAYASQIAGQVIGAVSPTLGAVNTAVQVFKQPVQQVIAALPASVQNQISDIQNKVGGFINSLIPQPVKDFGAEIGKGIESVKSYLGAQLQQAIAPQNAKINDLTGLMQTIVKSYGELAKVALPQAAPVVNVAVNALSNGASEFLGANREFINSIGREIVQPLIADNQAMMARFAKEAEYVLNVNKVVTDNLIAAGVIESENRAREGENIRRAFEALGSKVIKEGEQVAPLPGGILQGIITKNVGQVLGSIDKTANIIWNILEKMADGQYHKYSDFTKALTDAGLSSDLIGILFLIITAIPALLSVSSSWLIPIKVVLEQLQLAEKTPNTLPLNEAIKAFYTQKMPTSDVVDAGESAGFDGTLTQVMINNVRNFMDFSQLIPLLNRGELTKDEVIDTLKKTGTNQEDAENLVKLANYIPGIQDIIRFAVREVFSPDIAKEFGQFEDYPTEVTKYARLQGLTEEYAKFYWAAHWELPSLTQGYEMLHRHKIKEDELFKLMRAQDVMPHWRKPLMEIAYNPLTRVDIRRMYRTKKIAEKDLPWHYENAGYSPSDAKLLSDFTVAYEHTDEETEDIKLRKAAFAAYTKAFKRKAIEENEYISALRGLGYGIDLAKSYANIYRYERFTDENPDRNYEFKARLEAIIRDGIVREAIGENEGTAQLQHGGYSPSDIDFIIRDAALIRNIRRKDRIINALSRAYFSGGIDNNSLQSTLEGMGFSLAERNNIFQELNVLKTVNSKKLTRTDLKILYQRGQITAQFHDDYLATLGHSPQDIALIRLLNGVGE